MSEICVFRPALAAKKKQKMADFCGFAGVFVVGGALFWVLLVGKGAEKKSPIGFGVVFCPKRVLVVVLRAFLLLDFMVICCIVLV